MYREKITLTTVKKPEAQGDYEAPRSVASPEDLRQQMTSESEKEAGHFKNERANDIAQTEVRAENDRLTVDGEDRKALSSLGAEEDVAKKESGAEIAPAELPDKAEVRESKIEIANIVGLTRDPNFEGSIIIKTEDAEGWITGYAIRKNSLGNLEGNEIRYTKDGSIGPVYQLHESDFSKLREQGILELYENMPAMKERDVQNPELLEKKEASKKFLAEERKKLAQEILEQRKAQRERLSVLKINIEEAKNPTESLESELEDKQYAQFAERQSAEADTIAERLFLSELSEQEASDEQENVGQLIFNSEEIKILKAKLESHYAQADAIAQEKFEAMQKTVEQTMIRNNAFIVHTFLLDERFRHNENSNISQRATLEDDIDILLSLEPSISSSSVVPGSRQGLWGGQIGVVLGGGDIRGVAQTDAGTRTGGIKMRNGKISDSKEIDEKVSDKSERGYNELVVNNPEVFGFFQNVQIDESGRLIGFEDTGSEQDNKKSKANFMKYIDLAFKKGMPPLIMTPDRKLFEFLSINDEGIVSVGTEITPEQVARGKAGLSNEKRQEVGEQMIRKNLFRDVADQEEAKKIIAGLSGQETSDIELSIQEYLDYAKDNPDRFHVFPKHLLGDKNFMWEAAQFNPMSAYEYAGENLKKDVEFIKHIYSLENKGVTCSIYSLMPTDLKRNEEVALLAIRNNDFESLDATLADSPAVYEEIVDKMVDKINPNKWFSRNVGEGQSTKPSLHMRSDRGLIDLSERFLSDPNFIQKLNDKYANFKFAADMYNQLQITKLSE